jgi:hypothetical protein
METFMQFLKKLNPTNDFLAEEDNFEYIRKDGG